MTEAAVDRRNPWARLEQTLIVVLGLTLPLRSYPILVWHGLPIDPAHVAGGLLLLVAAIGLALRRRGAPNKQLVFWCLSILIACLAGLSRLGSIDFEPDRFARTFAHLSFMLAVFVVVASQSWAEDDEYRILRGLALFAFALTVHAAYEVLASYFRWPSGIQLLNRLALSPNRSEGYGFFRLTSFFEEPSWLANYLLDVMVYAYVLWLWPRKRSSQRWAGLWQFGILAVFLAILFTFSLGGILAASILVVLLMVHAFRTQSLRRAWPLLLAVVLTFGLSVALTSRGEGSVFRSLRRRVTSNAKGLFHVRLAAEDGDRSGLSYMQSAYYSLILWRSSPLYGVGLGQYRAAAANPRVQAAYQSDFANNPWTGLEWCAETGALGTAALGTMLIVIGRLRPRDAMVPVHWRALAAFLIASFLLKQTHSGSYISLGAWFPLGLAGQSLSRRFGSGVEGTEREGHRPLA